MTTFDEREKSYERKFQHDQELAFRTKARRTKLFGLWVAERLGLAGEAAQAYARDIVAADFGLAGDAAIIARAAESWRSAAQRSMPRACVPSWSAAPPRRNGKSARRRSG